MCLAVGAAGCVAAAALLGLPLVAAPSRTSCRHPSRINRLPDAVLSLPC